MDLNKIKILQTIAYNNSTAMTKCIRSIEHQCTLLTCVYYKIYCEFHCTFKNVKLFKKYIFILFLIKTN